MHVGLLCLVFLSLLPAALVVRAGYPECGDLDDLVLYDEHSCTSACKNCEGNGCDPGSGAQFSQFNRAYGDPLAAYEGDEGIRVTPTYWHQIFFRIYPGRTDIRCYEKLDFMIKATVDNKPLFQQLMLSDQKEGSWVDLEKYVEGGVIDNTKWHKVSIPLADLKANDFKLNSVFLINFARMMGSDPITGCSSAQGHASCDTPQNFFVDNMILTPATIVIVVLRYEFSSSRSLQLHINNGIKLEEVKANINKMSSTVFALTSQVDPNYSSPITPLKVGFSRAPVRAEYIGGQGFAESEWTIHLLYPTNLRDSTDYFMSGISGSGIDQDTLAIHRNARVVSPSVQVNQLGFIPDKPKHAYVANWLGDAGTMPVDGTTFEVVDSATDLVCYTGNLTLRFANDPQAGSDVYDANFSEFAVPGNYRVRVDGVGMSCTFDIDDQVYATAAYKTSRLLYYKRNIGLEEPYVDSGPNWSLTREPINPNLDGVFHPILETYLLHNGETAFGFKKISPGWFDAGDYGHYMHNLAAVWPAFNLVFDLGNPKDDVLNIPESGNGIPDLLDELEFGMQFALSMQAADGGVYWRLCSRTFDQVLPNDVVEQRIIYEKTTRATAQFAAMAAIHSRLIQPYNTSRANEVLEAGERAWEYLQTHDAYPPEGTFYRNPPKLPGGGEYSVSSSIPAQYWAAAELFRTTGKIIYLDAYKHLSVEASKQSDASTFMWWAMVMTENQNVDVVVRENARRGLMRKADMQIERAAVHPYRVPKHPFIQFSGWNSQSGSVIYSSAFLQAFYLTGNTTYSNEAFTSLDMTFGANPLSQTFITGLGHKPVQDPLDRVSLDDGVDTPIPGMPSPGFTWHLPAFREPYISVNNAFYPPEYLVDQKYNESYPVLRRYVDSYAVIPHNEGTINDAARYTAPLTIMSDGSNPPNVDGSYKWQWGGRGNVLDQTHIPLSEVSRIFPSYITQWGGRVGHAPAEYLNVFKEEQVCAINAPSTPYWVGKMNEETKEFLCKEQIVNFNHWSLFTDLPPSKVPFIPCGMMPNITWYHIRDTSPEWQAALSEDHIACMTKEQLTKLGWTSPTAAPITSAPVTVTPITSAPTRVPVNAPSCDNDKSWRFKNKKGKLKKCSWVKKKSAQRCKKKGKGDDGVKVKATFACSAFCNAECVKHKTRA
uniref:cellulase n=1 Tax=Corethron hystrix TaxID=216773 RepID=A0A7S1G1Y5_9STRA|mmetsp:Transcript_7129/g.15447  ORF Transcript_7129/g.15447 Transcript_7129/m.15447 type:complete len:1163 (+) Transcript_7129:27-3515(+)